MEQACYLFLAFSAGMFVGWRLFKFQRKVLVKDIMKLADNRSVISKRNNVIPLDLKNKKG